VLPTICFGGNQHSVARLSRRLDQRLPASPRCCVRKYSSRRLKTNWRRLSVVTEALDGHEHALDTVNCMQIQAVAVHSVCQHRASRLVRSADSPVSGRLRNRSLGHLPRPAHDRSIPLLTHHARHEAFGCHRAGDRRHHNERTFGSGAALGVLSDCSDLRDLGVVYLHCKRSRNSYGCHQRRQQHSCRLERWCGCGRK